MKKESLRKMSIILTAALVITNCMPGELHAKTISESPNQKAVVYSNEEPIEPMTTKNVAAPEEMTPQTINEEEPISEEPVTGEPISEEPTSEEPSTEEPTTEEPTTEEPTIDPNFVVENGVLVDYKPLATDKDNKEVIIPSVVEKIGSKVFEDYIYIEKVTFEEDAKIKVIDSYAFKNCKALNNIQLPGGITTIGIEAFRGCTAIPTITLPKTIVNIYKRAFYNCKKVKKLTLPKGLKKIGYHAFYKMTGLTSLTIPSTVTTANEIIGSKTSITKVTFSTGMKTIPTKVLLNATTVKKVVMHTGLITIGTSAFRNCKSLTTAKLPSTVTTIKTYAFRDCPLLKTLTLRKTVKSIGSKAFYGDTKLTLKVYANSTGKTYARKNKIKWEYTSSEVKRRAEDKRIYDAFMATELPKYSVQFKLKYLKNYVPQGTCIIGNYVVVSMYHKSLAKKSMLLVYKKSTGKYIKRVKLTIKDHVGSVTNVEKNLVVGINNLPTASDQVGIIKYKALKKAKNGSTLKFSYRLRLRGAADFAGYDGQYFWAGRSANSNSCLMYGYKVKKTKGGKLKMTNTYNIYVPANTQGLSVKKVSKYKRTFTVAQSYGRISDSYLLVYASVNIKKASSLKTAKYKVTLPSMIEGICISGKNIYMVFESGAKKYCGNVDNTSELQVKKVTISKYSSILKIK